MDSLCSDGQRAEGERNRSRFGRWFFWIGTPRPLRGRRSPRPFGPPVAALVDVLESRRYLSAVSPQLVAPPTIYAIVGEPTTILFENLVPTLTTDDLRFEVSCDIGTSTATAWTATPQAADVGDHVWQISLWQGDTLVDTRSSVIRVTATVDSGRDYNLLLVGDSLTHYSIYPNDLATDFAADGRGVTLLGTHHPTDAAANVFHEGYGGWTWNRFLTHYEPNPDPAFNKRSSPFVFLENGRATLNVPRYFSDSLGGAKPDFVTFLLGINDCIFLDPSRPDQVDLQIDAVLTSAESLISAFRTALPNTEFGICLTPPPNGRESAFTANYAGRYTRENWKPVQHRLVEKMIDRFEGREQDRLFVIPTGLNMSPEESYPANNAVHPNDRGYSEIAATIRGWLQTRMQPQTPSLSDAVFSLDENAPMARVVGQLAVENSIPSRRPVFEITGGPSAAAFAIDATTGELRVANSVLLDFETNPTLELTVTVRDPYVSEISTETTVTVNLRDVNDAPAGVILQNTVASLPEMTDSTSRLKVADIATFDDIHGVNILTLSGLDAAAFEIDAGTLYLRAGAVLDFEAKSRYVVAINADDAAVGGIPDASATFTLDLTDINEPPTAIALTNTVPTLPENANTAGRVKVADIAITDDALGDNTLTLSGDDEASFEIVDGGLYVRAGAVMDFERRVTYTVTVTLRDPSQSDPVDYDVNFILQLTNVNERPLVVQSTANLVVNDNATLQPFANLTVNDPDTQDAVVVVTIINGVIRGDFTPASTENWIRTVNGFDIVYARYFSPQSNIGAVVEPVIQRLVFQPRANAIKPSLTEQTDISVFVSDGLANTAVTSRITTVSQNDAPTIDGVRTTATVSDSAAFNPFNTLTVTDRDAQDMLISVTILNGVNRGDFINVATAGFTSRQVVGNDITYRRYFSPTMDVGAEAQAAFRTLTFQPRNNVLRPGAAELTDFLLTVSDGVAPAIANMGTRVTTVSANDAPVISGTSNSVTVNDNAHVAPFATVTIADDDVQDMFASVTILNGVFRGDFTNAAATGWNSRRVVGNDIVYTRYFNPASRIGSVVEPALRSLIYQPRSDVLNPGKTELTDFQITVSDGVANPVADMGTRVTTVSANDAPTMSGISSAVAVNDDAMVNPFSNVTIADRDVQEMLVTVTILNGVHRGDFSNAASSGWTPTVLGNDITYVRYFHPTADAGSSAGAAIRALTFQPRSNAIRPGTTELTDFRITVSDGVAAAIANSGTRVTTTSVNDLPGVRDAGASQIVNAGTSSALFSTLTVADADYQDMLVQITIVDGVQRGDFTAESTTGWTRTVSGANLVYSRYFQPAAQIGTTVQSKIRSLVFRSRTSIAAGQTQSTLFTISLKDGSEAVSSNQTSVTAAGLTQP
ncbi:MAG TPA: cadherin domain-containing protein [Planctomycetaceae bacterium]|nr:cadherin domain-containing protein [Planctomycetaceae bacterium]